MIRRDGILELANHHAEIVPVLKELIGEALTMFKDQSLTELWIEQYHDKTRKMEIGVTPIKEGHIGTMVWADNIKAFPEILSFLRDKEVGCTRVPNQSIGRVDGVQLKKDDVEKLVAVKSILDGMGLDG